jgi:hypothetical protein
LLSNAFALFSRLVKSSRTFAGVEGGYLHAVRSLSPSRTLGRTGGVPGSESATVHPGASPLRVLLLRKENKEPISKKAKKKHPHAQRRYAPASRTTTTAASVEVTRASVAIAPECRDTRSARHRPRASSSRMGRRRYWRTPICHIKSQRVARCATKPHSVHRGDLRE